MKQEAWDRLLRVAISKCKRHCEHTWCGYLTSVEIVVLVEAGVYPNYPSDLAHAATNRDNGQSKPRWFYFNPGKVKMRDERCVS